MERTVRHGSRLEGTVVPPGDKSISHRAALLNSIADGEAHVSNFCVGDDRSSMLGCLRGLGVEIDKHHNCAVSGAPECFKIVGHGKDGLSEPTDVLNSGNSGTTMRLVSGLTGESAVLQRHQRRLIVETPAYEAHPAPPEPDGG